MIFRVTAGILLGALLGLAYYKLVGCRTGACPITSNPYLTMAYGAALGFLFTYR